MTATDTLEFQALRCISEGSVVSQRTLAESLGVSLGKANYVIRALVARGLVKIEKAAGNPGRLGYVYLATPSGIAQKAKLTRQFLRQKLEEYDKLQKEIDSLAREAGLTDVRALAG